MRGDGDHLKRIAYFVPHRKQAIMLRYCFIDKPVKIIAGERETIGICRGIDLNGALLLEVNGVNKTVYGGEVSLRGQS